MNVQVIDTQDIVEAFAGKRDRPYTEEELDGFATEAGIPRSRLNKRWIIRKGNSYYLFLGGKYKRPVSSRELTLAARTALLPAITAGVTCSRYNTKGQWVPKTSKELLRDYSTLARNIVVDLAAQKSTYDWTTKTLTEAPCPLRDLKPAFNETVDQYLRLLGGDFEDELLTWIASVTKLDTPSRALLLCGPPGTGKTLLAQGLSRLWTAKSPTQVRDVWAVFNNAITVSPLIVADEQISVKLRHAIQKHSQTLRRPCQPNVPLQGALRFIVTTSSENKCALHPIQDLILPIQVSRGTGAFLNSLGDERNTLVQGDAIAKHALWLRDNR